MYPVLLCLSWITVELCFPISLQAMVVVNKALVSDYLGHADLIRTQMEAPAAEKDKRLYRDLQVYYLDMLPDVASNDCVAVTALLDVIFDRIHTYFPTAKCVGLFSDNATGYTAAVVLLKAPFLADKHALVLTDLLHGEAGDCKSENDSHFGVLGWVITRGVASGKDLTTLAELFNILVDRPVRNTVTSVVSCNEVVLERIKELHDAIKLVNVGIVRHVTYSKVDWAAPVPVTITLWRQSMFSTSVEVPAQVVATVRDVLSQAPFSFGPQQSGDGLALDSVIVRTNEDSVLLKRSMHWGRGAGSEQAKRQRLLASGGGGGDEPGGVDLPDDPAHHYFRPVFMPYRSKPVAFVCSACSAVMYDTAACDAHVCQSSRGERTIEAAAKRLAVDQCVSQARPSVFNVAQCPVLPSGTPNLPVLPVGYGSRPTRQEHNIHDIIKAFLTERFHQGDGTTKSGRAIKKLSPATAEQAVIESINNGTLPGVDLDDVPSQAAIQSLFNSLTAKKRQNLLRMHS
jgi:hypothetical protein